MFFWSKLVIAVMREFKSNVSGGLLSKVFNILYLYLYMRNVMIQAVFIGNLRKYTTWTCHYVSVSALESFCGERIYRRSQNTDDLK